MSGRFAWNIRDRRAVRLAAILACSFLLAFILGLALPGAFEPWNNRMVDRLFVLRDRLFVLRDRLFVLRDRLRRAEVSPYLIHVVMDDASHRALGLPSWDRRAFGELIAVLDGMKVRSVACDVFFRDASFPGNDETLLQATRRSGRVIFPALVVPQGAARRQRRQESLTDVVERNTLHPTVGKRQGRPPVAEYVLPPFDALSRAMKGFGHMNIIPDSDGVTRRVPLLYRYGNGYIPALSLKMALEYFEVDQEQIEVDFGRHILLRGARIREDLRRDVVIPVDRRGRIIVDFTGPWAGSSLSFPAREVLEAAGDGASRSHLLDLMEGALVVISDTSTTNRDYGPGVFDDLYPLSGLHVNVANSMLTRRFLADQGIPGSVLASFLFALALWLAAVAIRGFRFSLFWALLYALFLVFNAWLFIQARRVPSMAVPSLGFVLALVSVNGYRVFSSELERTFHRAGWRAARRGGRPNHDPAAPREGRKQGKPSQAEPLPPAGWRRLWKDGGDAALRRVEGGRPAEPVLIVHEEIPVLESLRVRLEEKGIDNLILCADGGQVLPVLKKQELSAIVLGLSSPAVAGRKLLAGIRETDPCVEVLVAAGPADIDAAVEYLRLGASDYTAENLASDRLVSALSSRIEKRQPRGEEELPGRGKRAAPLRNPEAFSGIVTRNAVMRSWFGYVESIAGNGNPVLITGESGVGKELAARVIHRLSSRKGKFVTVNMAGLDDTMITDTLFGHARGAFTDADVARRGLVEEASAGTLFLDEIGDMSVTAQVKLLRFIEEREYRPLGTDAVTVSDARIIIATNANLKKKLEEGSFRGDLFYRLTYRVDIPPLRERLEDLPLLVDHFVRQTSQALGRRTPAVPKELVPLLREYTFPGNVRELKNMIENAASRDSSGPLPLSYFRHYLRGGREQGTGPGMSVDLERNRIECSGALPTLQAMEDLLLAEALRRARGNQNAAARLLGLSPSALSRRLKKRRERRGA